MRLYNHALTADEITALASTDGLAGHWKLDETSGTVAADSSGVGNDGTYTGTPTLGAPGVYGKAATLNTTGTSDYIDLPSTALNGVSDTTVAFWIKTTRTGASTVLSGAGPTSSNEFIVFFANHTSLRIYIHGAAVSWAVPSIADGAWHHFAVVMDDAANEVTVYRDTVSLGTKTHGPGGTPLAISAGGLVVGQEQDCVGGCFDPNQIVVGDLDDLRIYSRALTPQEIIALYGLVGHWKLDEASGTTATDSSALGNDGTYINSPTLGVPGVYGNAAAFNGSGPRVSIPNSPSLEAIGNGDTAFGVAFWMKLQQGSTGSWRSIIHKGNAGRERTFAMWMRPRDNRVHYRISTTSSWNEGGNSIGSIPIGTWTHITYVYEAGTLRFYINGNLDSSRVLAGTVVGNNGPLYLGKDPWAAGANACWDDVRLHSRALAPQEITAFYGLVGHWKLDETSGTTAVDSSGLGNDGAYIGSPTLGEGGVYKNSTQFHGTTDYVNVPGSSSMNVSNALTVSCWAKSNTVTWNTYGMLVSKRNQFVMHPRFGTKTLNFYVYLPTVGWRATSINLNTIENFDLRQWHHYVGHYDPSSGTLALYVDGELVSSRPLTAPIGSDLGPLTIGRDDGISRYFDGYIDDVRLYNRAISALEISELYGLVGHWKMDEGFGTTAADSTAFGNDATLYGASWTTDCAGNNGLEYDGLNDTATTNSSFNPPDIGTVAVWLRSAGDPGARSRPFGVGGDWEVRQEPDGTLSFDLGAEGPDVGAGPDAFITNEGLSFQNRWYHVIAQFDASDDSFEVYIDGDLVHSGINGNDMTKQLANTLSFGTRTGNTEYWEGGMRDFRVYKRWLSGFEISELSGLVALWKLDETSGTVAADSSPNGYDGTLSGNPVWATAAGIIDGAIDLETTDGVDHIDVGTFNVTGDELSITAWVKPEIGVTDGRIVIKSITNSLTTHYGVWLSAVRLNLIFG